MKPGKRLSVRCWATVLVLVWLGTCVGCGNNLATVEGTVTFDGEPVDNGTIVLEPADGKGPTAGGKIEQGKYLLADEAGVMPGKKIVRITAVRKTGRQHDASMPGAEGAGGPSAPAVMVDQLESYIPAIYNQKSTLTFEVVAGKGNQHDFELKSQ
ncbi:MAG: hypothetical protein ABIP48_01420 [Planctomycetota bacterium]